MHLFLIIRARAENAGSQADLKHGDYERRSVRTKERGIHTMEKTKKRYGGRVFFSMFFVFIASAAILLTATVGMKAYGFDIVDKIYNYVNKNDVVTNVKEFLFSPKSEESLQGLPDMAGYKKSGLPDVDTSAWYMKLVNRDNPVSRGFEPKTGITSEGYMFDERALPALEDMLSDGRAAGHDLVLTSAYRTYAYQNKLYEDKADSLVAQGYSRKEAEDSAATVVARPGTSEHQLALAADIVSNNNSIMEAGYAQTPEAVWLREHCADYGFILRYPEDKLDITGVIFEPWHFRYVGGEAAEYIMKNGITFEEFLALYN